MATMQITWGFLTGNLGWTGDETAEYRRQAIAAYADAVNAAILETFPGAEIDADWQDAAGSTPSLLQPKCYRGSADYDGSQADETTVAEIIQSVYDDGQFWPDTEEMVADMVRGGPAL
jgi:hypothetical protein